MSLRDFFSKPRFFGGFFSQPKYRRSKNVRMHTSSNRRLDSQLQWDLSFNLTNEKVSNLKLPGIFIYLQVNRFVLDPKFYFFLPSSSNFGLSGHVFYDPFQLKEKWSIIFFSCTRKLPPAEISEYLCHLQNLFYYKHSLKPSPQNEL